MAPIRRYLRITKYSVLECRIYLENPALAQSWLLNPRNPVLPRVIESVRPLVLPKLREERERERLKKKNKKRSIKDVVVEDDFEVSIFLTETETRHSILHKQKHFRDKVQTKLTSNSSKLIGASNEAPIDVDVALPGDSPGSDDVQILQEDSEGGDVSLDNIPSLAETAEESGLSNRRSKRRRGQAPDAGPGPNADDPIEVESDPSDDELFIGQSESDASESGMRPPPPKRHKDKATDAGTGEQDDKKKKLAMDISYEGFAIYGRVLCLVVKRRAGISGFPAVPSGGKSQTGQPGGQAMMENWITSTQLPEAGMGDDDA
ncbi:hypothetical protein V8F20_006284 [Naviculisporaceae sp. PSN 640]